MPAGLAGLCVSGASGRERDVVVDEAVLLECVTSFLAAE